MSKNVGYLSQIFAKEMKLYLRIISIQYLKGVTHLSKKQMYVKTFVPGCQEKRTPMAKKGNGNIAKWDDFPVEVEVADEVVISGHKIHFELSSSSGHQNCCEVLCIVKQKIADVRVQLHELLRKNGSGESQ